MRPCTGWDYTSSDWICQYFCRNPLKSTAETTKKTFPGERILVEQLIQQRTNEHPVKKIGCSFAYIFMRSTSWGVGGMMNRRSFSVHAPSALLPDGAAAAQIATGAAMVRSREPNPYGTSGGPGRSASFASPRRLSAAFDARKRPPGCRSILP